MITTRIAATGNPDARANPAVVRTLIAVAVSVKGF
jgi:hypothetical protein